ncbi:MAG TPA: hypothetical protein VJ276_08925 [Thermoanaerobaculia bacterium]|nr:hypothetical protein [Thermoanaerobaculia bacterium]
MELTRKTAAVLIACAIALLSVVVLADDAAGDDAFDVLAEPVGVAVVAFGLASLACVAEIRRGLSGPQWVRTLSDPRSPPCA